MKTRTHYTTTVQAFCNHPKAFKTTSIRADVDCAKCLEVMGTVRSPAKENPVYVEIRVETWGKGWSWTIIHKNWEMNSSVRYQTEKSANRSAVIVANRCRFTVTGK